MTRPSSGIGALTVVPVLILALGIAVRAPRAWPQAKSSTPNSAMVPMPLVAPLFIANGEFTSKLILVNASGLQTFADVTVRAPDGTQLATQHVTFAAYSQQQLDLGALLLSKGIAAPDGSVVVTPSPDLKGPAILAALSMTYLNSREGDFIDEELAMPTPEDSQILRGVTDLSSGSPVVAISSLADTPQHVTVQCFGSNPVGFAKTIALGAGQTVLTEACTGRSFNESSLDTIWTADSSGPQNVTEVALTSDGMPGSFAAFGLSPHQTTGDRHFSSVAYSDPKMATSASTVFTGVPVGDVSLLPARTYTPAISLANFSAKPAHVSIQYAVTSGETPGAQQVWSGVVPAAHTTDVPLGNLQGDTNLQDSLIVTADGSPGDVIAKLTAETDGGMQEIEVLGKDANVFENGGGHPWTLDNGTDSTLLLFNHSTETQTVVVMVSAGNGTAQWTKTYTLQSVETEEISLRDLIQNKTKDDVGKTIAANATSGVVDWFSFKRGVTKGRILQSDATTGMARNFSCGEYTTINSAYWSDSGTDGDSSTNYVLIGATDYQVGDATAVLDLVYPGSCSGSFATDSASGFGYDYTSSAPSTAAIVSQTGNPAEVNADSGGYATIYGTVTDPSTGCSGSAQGSAFVQKPTSLTANSSQVISMSSYCVNPSNTYGILVAITYQVLDQESPAKPIKSSSMEPQEEVYNFVVNGVNDGNPIPNWQDLGPTSYPGTSKYTNSSGQYVDAPVGFCIPQTFTGSVTQYVTILVNGTRYPTSGNVRVNSWSGSSSSSGHGSISNNNDV